MSEKSELLILYEDLEKNKQAYIAYIDDFFSKVDACIASRDLLSLNSLYDELIKSEKKEKPPLIYSSKTFRIQSLKEALNLEKASGLPMFWDDISDLRGLLYKYNKTILMIRRLNSHLPDEYRQEAHSYLKNISPYIVMVSFRDPTVWVGNPDYIYLTLATDCIQDRQFTHALIFLQMVNKKNDEINTLINQLTNLVGKATEDLK